MTKEDFHWNVLLGLDVEPPFTEIDDETLAMLETLEDESATWLFNEPEGDIAGRKVRVIDLEVAVDLAVSRTAKDLMKVDRRIIGVNSCSATPSEPRPDIEPTWLMGVELYIEQPLAFAKAAVARHEDLR